MRGPMTQESLSLRTLFGFAPPLRSMEPNTTTAWHLVIELLADLKQIDTPILRAATARTPGFCDEASEAVKERVALRYLEKFSDFASQGFDCHIDEELSAEEVLCRHVGASQNSGHDSRAKWSKQQLEHFILQKKPTLPKCSLHLVEESISKGQSQLLSSLKNFSDLSICCEVGKQEANRGAEMESMEKLKFKNAGEVQTPEQQAPVSAPDTAVMVFQGDPSGAQQHFSKQNDGTNNEERDQLQREGVGAGNEIAELCSSSLQMSDKEKGAFHQSSSNAVKENEHQPLPERGHIAGEHSVIPETRIDGDGHHGLTLDLGPNDDAFGFQKHGQKSQISVNMDSMTVDHAVTKSCMKCKKGGMLLICSTKSCLVAVHESCLRSIANFDEKGLFRCPFCSFRIASVAYYKAKKNLSRAEKALREFFGWDFGTQMNGKKTSVVGVPRVKSQAQFSVHIYDQKCPPSSKYETNSKQAAEVKQQVPAARVCNEGDNVLSDDEIANDNQDIVQLQHFQQAGAANIINYGEVPHNVLVLPTCGIAEANHSHKEREDCDEGFDLEHAQNSSEPRAVDGNRNFSCQEVNILQPGKSDGFVELKEDNGVHQEAIMEVQNAEQTEVVIDHSIQSSPHQESTSSTIEKHVKRRKLDLVIEKNHHMETTIDDENRVKSSSVKYNRTRSRPKHYSNLALPSARQKVPWTSKEEEVLKAGVEQYARDGDTFPWAKILQFGQGIFHTVRRPSDLKDKWRNIMIKEGKAKRTRDLRDGQ